MDGLKFRTTFGIDYINGNVHQYESPEHGGGKSENGTSDMTNTRVFNWTTQNNLEYDVTIGENELLKRVDCISFAIPSSLFRTTSTRTGSNEICAAFFNNHSPTCLTTTSLFPARYLPIPLEPMLLYPPVL